MSDFRETKNQPHPNKTNTLMLGILLLLILILSIQIWLLYSALNNALDEHRDIAIPAFIGSFILFVTALWLLRYLPEPRGTVDKRPKANKYK